MDFSEPSHYGTRGIRKSWRFEIQSLLSHHHKSSYDLFRILLDLNLFEISYDWVKSTMTFCTTAASIPPQCFIFATKVNGTVPTIERHSAVTSDVRHDWRHSMKEIRGDEDRKAKNETWNMKFAWDVSPGWLVWMFLLIFRIICSLKVEVS